LRLVDPPDGTPRAGRQGEWALRLSEAPEELPPQCGLGVGTDRGRIPARRAHAGEKRRPQVVEVVVSGFRDERLHADFVETSLEPELLEVIPAGVPHDRASAMACPVSEPCRMAFETVTICPPFGLGQRVEAVGHVPFGD
jgi:hypothetical protein